MKLIGMTKGGTVILEANGAELRFLTEAFAGVCGEVAGLIATSVRDADPQPAAILDRPKADIRAMAAQAAGE